jgi:RimJ/RimL family protein N-acetyltransferase
MLRGERVTLRPIEREDIARLYELRQNVDLHLLANDRWHPRSLARMERDFEKRLDEDESHMNWFAVEAEGALLGTAGLHTLNRWVGTAALGITLYDRERLGRGYGREAVGLLLDWAFRIQNWRRIWLDVLATNERAVRSYQALGFVLEGRLRAHDYHDGAYRDMLVMGMLREEWENRRSRQQS